MTARNLSLLCTLLLLAAGASAADLKMKTRNTFGGMSMEGATLIKGARQRQEQKMPMGMSMTSIYQCDLKRIVQINDRSRLYLTMPLDSGEAQAAPARPAAGARRGGVVTVTANVSDTGERKPMFGYTARRLRSSMTVESSPNSCAGGAGSRIQTDGWYIELPVSYACSDMPWSPQMSEGGEPGCRDSVRYSASGATKLGFPIQVNTTIETGGQKMTTTLEVVELSQATLDAKLFDIPPGYREARSYQELMGMPAMGDLGAMMKQATAGEEMDEEEMESAMAAAAAMAQPPAAPPPAAPAAAPAARMEEPPAPAKAAGMVRVGVVAIDDLTQRSLPTDNLREKLMAEIRLLSMDAIPLESKSDADLLAEAQDKDADYILYADIALAADPGQPLQGKALVRAADPASAHSQLALKLVKVAQPAKPQMETEVTTSAPRFLIDAVGEGITESAKVVTEEIRNPKPKAAPPARKPAVKKK